MTTSMDHAVETAPVAVPPRRRLRSPEPAPHEDDVLQALCMPCARFDARGYLRRCNSAFTAEFGETAGLTRSAFGARFERFTGTQTCGEDLHCANADDRSCEEVYCPGTGRSYALQWSRLGGVRGDWLVTAMNLTERMESLRRHRALQEQLLFTSRAMSVGEMATTLAHELNQPLAAIINYLGTAQRLGEQVSEPPPRLGQALSLARSQAEHAAAVIARMREFVRTREPRRERHALRDLVTHVLQLLQLEAQKHRVHVAVELPDSLPAVWADRVMIEQVLANLIKNGIEAMRNVAPGNRRMRISARRNADDRIEVRVADRGCGLGGADESQVFSPFYTTKPQGMGVGLAICRSIVEFHEGTLYFEHHPEGGAVFVFSLSPAA